MTEDTPRATLHHLAALLDPLEADAAERRAALEAGRQLGPITGIKSLDSILSGRLETGLHVVAGGAGAGKTAFCLSVACNSGVPTLFVSGEIGMVEIMRRLTAARTRTYLGKFKNGTLTGPAVRELAARAIVGLELLGVMDATQAAATTVDLANALASIRESPSAKDAKGPGALIVVDSLHSWANRTFADVASEYDRLATGFAELETLAQVAGVPILLISEQTKDAQKETGGGGLNSGAGHRRIAYAPETLIVLTKDAKANESAEGDIEVVLKVEKNRHGKTGVVPLLWNGGFQTHRPKGGA